MNNELRKNTEGYTDPTAAATLTQPEPGDIWTYNNDICLIVKNHGHFSSILLLMDDCKDPAGDVEIQTRNGLKYTDPCRITYGLHRKMGRYLETVSVEDFGYTIEAVGQALAIELPRKEKATGTEKADTQEAAKLQEQLTIALEHIKVLESLQGVKKAELAAADRATERAKNQLELLRDMYNELLAKVVGGGVVNNAP